MKAAAPGPTEAELEMLARRHFSHEVFALVDGRDHARERPISRDRPVPPGVPSQLMHSHDLLLHTRVLADFLLCADVTCKGSPHKNDVEARHYVPGWDGFNLPEGDKDHIDQALAHLSRHRLDVGRIAVAKRIDMANRVLAGLMVFIEALPPDTRPWFHASEAEIRAALL